MSTPHLKEAASRTFFCWRSASAQLQWESLRAFPLECLSLESPALHHWTAAGVPNIGCLYTPQGAQPFPELVCCFQHPQGLLCSFPNTAHFVMSSVVSQTAAPKPCPYLEPLREHPPYINCSTFLKQIIHLLLWHIGGKKLHRPSHWALQNPQTFSRNIAHWEMIMKIHQRWYYTSSKLATFFHTLLPNCWRNCNFEGASLHIWWDCPVLSSLWSKIATLSHSLKLL